jgi:para-aminobenzoate synthetase/4-amino-4-deoxychorismate lyase
MILDLMRNDLSRVSQAGSVKVEKPFAVESYPTVHQMVSTVRAQLLPGRGAADMLRALFPCGSITGAPKIRAMELIGQVERDARGPYCGAIGRIDASGPNGTGDAAFNVAIRTLRLTPGEGGQGRAVLGVGSAIVADSDGMTEWRECLVKGGFVRQSSSQLSAAGFDLIETMSFTPDAGVPLLERHLERITASALELGFAFDRHAVRNAIQALCFEADKPARLRLVVARSGAYSLEIADLPAPLAQPATCAVLRFPIDEGDWRLRHKSSDRGFYEAGLKAARGAGADEALFLRDDGLLTEGCFTNLFVERDGKLLTPPARLGLLPGVLRASLLAEGRAEEAELRLDDLAQGFFIGNALRGLIPARLLA